VVANQPVREVLLAMARESRACNFDIHQGVEGNVNLNAIDQTLKQILTRIARQVDVRWETDGQTITVMPDTPFLRTYQGRLREHVARRVGVDRRAEPGGGAKQHPQHPRPRHSRTLPSSGWTTPRRTASGRRWRRTSRTSCGRPTSSCPRAAARPFVQARGQNLTGARSGQRARAATATAPYSSGGNNTVPSFPRRWSRWHSQAADVVEQRLTFREAASS
jgi:general secretion pathway protein D